jgi:toxin FitB
VKWLLDTNVISESVRDRPHRAVLAWIAAQPPEDTTISIVTLAELRDGALTHRDEVRRRKLTDWVDLKIAEWFRDRTLPLTAEILIDWLQLARKFKVRGNQRDAADLLIAATARIHDLVLVSRNTRDFANTGIIVYDPWNDRTHHMDDS